eukprot:5760-Pelagococcus_subviridis.AAC.2
MNCVRATVVSEVRDGRSIRFASTRAVDSPSSPRSFFFVLRRGSPSRARFDARSTRDALLPPEEPLLLAAALRSLARGRALRLERLLVLSLRGSDPGRVEAVLFVVHLLLRTERVLPAAARRALVILREVVEVRAAVDVPAVAADHGDARGLLRRAHSEEGHRRRRRPAGGSSRGGFGGRAERARAAEERGARGGDGSGDGEGHRSLRRETATCAREA